LCKRECEAARQGPPASDAGPRRPRITCAPGALREAGTAYRHASAAQYQGGRRAASTRPLLRGAQARAATFPFVKNKHAVMGWLTKNQASSASNCTRAAAKVILVPSDRQIVSARLTRTSPTCAPPATARVRTSPSRGASCVAQAALRAPEIVAISRVTAIAARWRAKLRTTKPPTMKSTLCETFIMPPSVSCQQNFARHICLFGLASLDNMMSCFRIVSPWPNCRLCSGACRAWNAGGCLSQYEVPP
jgi:hypothetical protein